MPKLLHLIYTYLLDVLSSRLYLSLKHMEHSHICTNIFYIYIQYLKYKVDCIVTVQNIASFLCHFIRIFSNFIMSCGVHLVGLGDKKVYSGDKNVKNAYV